MRFILTCLLFLTSYVSYATIKIENLKCNNIIDPIGIEFPTFSWKIISNSDKVVQQLAWEIEIASSKDKLLNNCVDIWKSGEIKSSDQFDIVPTYSQFDDSEMYWWRVRIRTNENELSDWSEPSSFIMGLNSPKSWKAEWIRKSDKKESNLPLFRKVFNIKQNEYENIEKAIVHLCCLGNGDLFVNGIYADSTRILDPAQTNYDKYAFYNSLDVTGLLKKGANCIGIQLSNGWYNQNKVLANFSYGDPTLKLQMHINYKNGKKKVIKTDESWLWKEGPIIYANVYEGEVYDARKEQKDWAKAEASISGWKKVSIENKAPSKLFPQIIPSIRMHGVIGAEKLYKTQEGKWIYDFGRNRTGNILLSVKLPRGTRVKIQTSEELDDNNKMDYRSTGTIVAPIQTDEYIVSGYDKQVWIPRNTYHGFRYAELSYENTHGVSPTKEWLQVVPVHTDLEQSGYFNSSNEQINKLHDLAIHTMINNMQGVPIDCPHREKCGWLGDVHAYIKMAVLNYDMNNFLMKYMDDIISGGEDYSKRELHHLQKNKKFYFKEKMAGIPYMIAPGKRHCGVASPDWGTAIVQIPWHLYLYYGNKIALEKYYENMKQWTDYVSTLEIDHIVYEGLGDWCPPNSSKNNKAPIEFTSSAFHYYDVCIMEKAAQVLNKIDDKIRFAEQKEKIRHAMINKFFNPRLKTFGSQTADALALDFGIYPKGMNEEIASSIVENIKDSNDFFYTGIFGLCRIGSALSRNGQWDKAWKTFTKKGEYSFAWMWEKAKATSLWEVLPISDETINVAQTVSHSHPMQSGYDYWFYEDIAGIRPCEDNPGFRTVIFSPLWETDIKKVEATINSRYGSITSKWTKDGKHILWEVNVPNGSNALICKKSFWNISRNNIDLDNLYPIITDDDGCQYYQIESGHYFFTVNQIN